MATAASYDPVVDAEAARLRRSFRRLDELAAERGADASAWRADVAAGRRPAPSYVLDGDELVPPSWADLADEAGGVDGLRALFEARYAVASDATGALAGPDELDEAWEEYLSGAWGRVLFEPTPESAVQANRLAGAIAELLDAPAPDDDAWCRRLAARVDALAALLREGIAADRANDEPHPWDRWVAGPRRDYAAAMARFAPTPDGDDDR